MPHLQGLTDEQYASIKSNNPRLFVSAGPGSGKTRVLTTRIFDQIILPLAEEFINDNDFKGQSHYFASTWVITFTNKAARELKERIEKLLRQYVASKNIENLPVINKRLGSLIKRKVYVGTFHSLGYQLLQRYGQFYLQIKQFSIIDIREARGILKLVIKQLKEDLSKMDFSPFPVSSLDKFKVPDFLKLVDSHKQSYRHPSNSHLPVEDPWSLYSIEHFIKVAKNSSGILSSSEFKLYEELYKRYLDHMRHARLLDFDDMLQWAINLLHRIPPPVTKNFIRNNCPSLLISNLYVDEFQDTNRLQLEFLSTVYCYCSQVPFQPLSITLVGDPDQTIFTWRNFPPVLMDQPTKSIPKFSNILNEIPETLYNTDHTENPVWKTPSIFNSDAPVPTLETGWEVILLTANFRSVQNITSLAKFVIKFDSSREQRVTTQTLNLKEISDQMPLNLFQANKISKEKGPPIFVGKMRDTSKEIQYAVSEISKLRDSAKSHGTTLNYKDFAILMRTSYHSKQVQESLTSAGIPCSGLGGPGLWNGKSVRDILAYFRLLRNPFETSAIIRAVNVPPRKVGSVTLTRLIAFLGRAQVSGIDALDQLVASKKGSHPDDSKIAGNAGIKQFLSVFNAIRSSITCSKNQSRAPDLVEVFDSILQHTAYEAYLKTCAENANSKYDGSEEDEAKPTLNEPLRPLHGLRQLISGLQQTQLFDDDLFFMTDYEANEESALPVTLLALIDSLLEAAGLGVPAEEVGAQAEAPDAVCVTTFHSSKGLEWPIVFIIDAKRGSVPHFRSYSQDQLNEEARVFYVGITRTKFLLNITWPGSSKRWDSPRDEEQSPFLPPKSDFLSSRKLTLNPKFWSVFNACVLNNKTTPIDLTEVVDLCNSGPESAPISPKNEFKPYSVAKFNTDKLPGFVSAASLYSNSFTSKPDSDTKRKFRPSPGDSLKKSKGYYPFQF